MRDLAIRFCATVLVLLSAYAAVSQTSWFERGVVMPHLAFVARGTGVLLGLLGEDATVDGRIVRTSGFTFRTARGCDAIGATVIVSCLIAAFPTRARTKLLGAAVSTAILVAVNFLRTTSLALIGTHHRSYYDFAHRDVWQSVFALLSVGLFVAWIRLAAAGGESERRSRCDVVG